MPIHYDASKEVLSSVFSIDAVGGFYAIGGSRITFLDLLFVLALVGAIGWSSGALRRAMGLPSVRQPDASWARERVSEMQRIYLHPLPVRIWHWINAVTCVLLFLTGVQIRYVGLIDVISFRTRRRAA